jgi:DNA helicase-2/ATP-dependent DNA helicase PcrA
MSGGAWRHPQGPSSSRPPPPPVDPGERYVDKSYFEDDPGHGGDGEGLRRGSKVFHERFGEGEVRKVETSGEPAVIAFFPGWGEKKILARFLKPV